MGRLAHNNARQSDDVSVNSNYRIKRHNMNEDIKDLANELSGELSRLYLILEQCRQLYSNPKTVSILNKNAGVFFQIVQSQFFDALLLGISRLTDKKSTGGRDNLSINAMHCLIHDDQLKAELTYLSKKAEVASQFAREHRNKRISHSDQEHYKNRESFPLNAVTFAKVEGSLKAIEDAVGLIFSRLSATTVVYKFINLEGSADALVGKLKQLDKISTSK